MELPLKISSIDVKHGKKLLACVRDSEGQKVTHDVDLERAEFIVCACNSHDKLVAALKRITAYGDVFAYRTSETSPYQQAIEALTAAGA